MITDRSTFVLARNRKHLSCRLDSGLRRRVARTCSFLPPPPASIKTGSRCSFSSTVPAPVPLVMTASIHSPNITTTDWEKDRDPEALTKVESYDVSADNGSEEAHLPWEVTLEKSENPKAMAVGYKWFTVVTVSLGALCVTCASSMASVTPKILPKSDLTRSYLQAAFAEVGTMKEFGISRTVSILPMSCFLLGVGIGPLLVGPLSEVYGVLCDLRSSVGH